MWVRTPQTVSLLNADFWTHILSLGISLGPLRILQKNSLIIHTLGQRVEERACMSSGNWKQK